MKDALAGEEGWSAYFGNRWLAAMLSLVCCLGNKYRVQYFKKKKIENWHHWSLKLGLGFFFSISQTLGGRSLLLQCTSFGSPILFFLSNIWLREFLLCLNLQNGDFNSKCLPKESYMRSQMGSTQDSVWHACVDCRLCYWYTARPGALQPLCLTCSPGRFFFFHLTWWTCVSSHWTSLSQLEIWWCLIQAFLTALSRSVLCGCVARQAIQNEHQWKHPWIYK